MSKVISFRLNANNKREADALNILQERLMQGFTTRQTITKALLSLNSSKSQITENQLLADLSHQIKDFLGNLELGIPPNLSNNEISSQVNLSEGFVSSILKVAKPGLTIDPKY